MNISFAHHPLIFFIGIEEAHSDWLLVFNSFWHWLNLQAHG
jgi:hypothetical protein